MPLLTIRDLSIAFSGPALLNRVQLSIEPGERICLIGRNGEGKSTLLKLIAGELKPDAGEFERLPSLRISKLDQEFPETLDGSVFDIVSQGQGAVAELLSKYHQLSAQIGEDDAIYDELDAVQKQLESNGGWELEQRVERALTRLGLSGDDLFSSLSGGMKRRTLLAKALVNEPDILLLDEPTNHLDIDSICWLEDFLLKCDIAVLFITHDRKFLKKLATRIIEVDRGQLTSWNCNYEKYLLRKAEHLEAEQKQNAVFDKKLAEEEVWIRKGIQARRTRNEGRVRALKQMRRDRQQRREQVGKMSLSTQEGQTSGRKVITVKKLSKAYENKPLIEDFTTTLWRGDKIGIIGPNGSGKSTLIRLLLGELAPDSGEVIHGTKLETVYFDQHRTQLDETKSVMENVCDSGETVQVGGKSRHILSYLQDFMFTPEIARGPISQLSGGERNRLFLAKLFTQPSNFLVMDEPTNDLDLESIELLEELLLSYSGTLILVSHDRDFLDNIVTSTISLEGKGVVNEQVGGYQDWFTLQQDTQAAAQPVVEKKKTTKASRTERPRTISQKEQRELDALPALIEELESKQEAFIAQMSESAFFQQPKEAQLVVSQELKDIEETLKGYYERWEFLEALPKK